MSIYKDLISICFRASQISKRLTENLANLKLEIVPSKNSVERKGRAYGNDSSWTWVCRKAIQLTLPRGLPALAMKNEFPDVK